MNSTPEPRPDACLVLVGGEVRSPARAAPAEPMAALEDLMTVVEALSPRWPARFAMLAGVGFRL